MMDSRNNSPNKIPNVTTPTKGNNSTNSSSSNSPNSSSNSPFNSPNKSGRRDSSNGSSSNMTMAARIRMFIGGVFVGVVVARPLLMMGGMSADTAASLESYMVLPAVHTNTGFDPTASGTREAETTIAVDDASRAQLRSVAATNMYTNTSSSSAIVDFEAQPRVVIATKIHGPPHIPQLKQSLCLLTAAYNNRPVYDIVVFTTLPVTKIDEKELQEIVHPAHLTIETDKKTLSQHINAMDPDQKRILYERCNRTYDDEIYWGTRACEVGGGACMPLAYTWQSEFRAKHIWKHAALQKYKYMLWYDSDAMATRVWRQDPVTVMIRNDLAMFFDHFPQGKTRGTEVQDKIKEAYNDTLCGLRLGKNGHLVRSKEGCGAVPQIHGFFHITNLDFYRSPENLRWYDILIGDNKFSRKWDDQLSVTVPAAMRAANRSWEMGANGVKLDVWHNGMLDGKTKWKGGGYLKWWKKEAEVTFPEAFGSCKRLVTNPGR